MMLFSGTSNQPLAQKVAEKLGISLGNIEITRFMDNECRVFVKEDVEQKEVFVLQSLSIVADQHLVELCLLGSALKDLNAKKVTAVIPWMGYSKQDKAFRKGEAVSAQLVAKFIEAAGFDAVITCELHSENVIPYFHIPVTEISTHALFARGPLANAVVAAPDRGGKSRSKKFADELGLRTAYLEKTRDVQTGIITVTGVDGEVNHKNVIIFDDIINTGETAIKTSEFLKNHGASRVDFYATHAVLAGNAGEKLQKSAIDSISVTDTIAIQKTFAKLSVVSVSSLIHEHIT